jgi:hypothetical protein
LRLIANCQGLLRFLRFTFGRRIFLIYVRAAKHFPVRLPSSLDSKFAATSTAFIDSN